jgi:hypothetical protein
MKPSPAAEEAHSGLRSRRDSSAVATPAEAKTALVFRPIGLAGRSDENDGWARFWSISSSPLARSAPSSAPSASLPPLLLLSLLVLVRRRAAAGATLAAAGSAGAPCS